MSINNDDGIYWNGETGPQGPEGPQGPQGPQGPSGVNSNSKLWNEDSNTVNLSTSAVANVFRTDLTSNKLYLMNICFSCTYKIIVEIRYFCTRNGSPYNSKLSEYIPSLSDGGFYRLQKLLLLRVDPTDTGAYVSAYIRSDASHANATIYASIDNQNTNQVDVSRKIEFNM